MFKFLDLRPEIFAVDINDLSVKIAKIKKKRNGFCLSSFGETKIAQGVVKEGVIQNEEILAKTIKSACAQVKGEKFRTKYVIASLPEEKSFLQIIQMPKMIGKDLESAIFFEAENYIPLSMDKIYLDFNIIDSHDKSSLNHIDVLINAMPKNIVDSYVSCLKRADLAPVALETESQAITRALAEQGENSSPTVFIDFSQTKTNFIISSKNSIRFTSSIPISSQQITKAISDGLSIDFDKAENLKMESGIAEINNKKNNLAIFINPILSDLSSHIRKYINFYHERALRDHFLPDGQIAKIVLCGGGAELKGLANFLSKELKVGVELGDPFRNIIIKKKKMFQSFFAEKELSFVIVMGLALRGAVASRLTQI